MTVRRTVVLAMAATACLPLVSACGSSDDQPAAHAATFSHVWRGSDPDVLYIPIDESTMDETSPCWEDYWAHVVETPHLVSVRLTAAYTSTDDVNCSASAVEAYLLIRLRTPYAAQPVEDARTHRRAHIAATVLHPMPDHVIRNN